MKKVIIEDKDVYSLLESYCYEVETRKDFLAFMINNNMDQTDFFKKYYTEFQDFFIKYSIAKDDFESNYIQKNIDSDYKNWHLNFSTGELTIEKDV